MRGDRLAMLIVVLAAMPVLGDDLRPRAVVSWETRNANGLTTSRLRQDIDVFLSRAFTETIELDMIIGAGHYNQSSERAAATSETRALEIRPSGTLRADFGPVSTSTSWAVRRSRHDNEGGRSERSNEQLAAGASWGATTYVPGGTLRGTRYRIDDRDREFVNDDLSAVLNYAWRGFSVTAGRSYRTEGDTRGAYRRSTTDTTAGLNYSNTFWRKLSVTAGASGTDSRVDDGDRAGSRVPTYVTPSRVLWAVDDTPLDSSDHPLAAYPALNDGRTELATPIDFGPQGASFQAIAFDFGRASPVDEIQIVVRDERMEPVTNPAGVTFDVYTSTDGLRWIPHAANVVTQFDTVRSIYEIGFDQVDVQWIKVVTFGSAGQPVIVTEAYALFHRVVGANANDSRFRTLASNVAISVTPVGPLTISYTGAAYRSEQKAGESLESNIRDILHSLSARYDPRGWLGLEARYEMHDVDTDRVEQAMRAVIGSIRLSPRPQLTATLQCDRREEEFDVLLLTGRSCSASLSARVFTTFDVAAGMSDRHEQTDTGGTQDTRSIWLNSSARVTRTLRVLVSAATSRSSYDDWTGPIPPPGRDDRYSTDIDWVSGRALGLGATLTWVETPGFSGVLQRYRVRWSPFGDGSVSLITSYMQDIDPYTDNRSERVLISPRWQINPRAALNLTYSSIANTGEQSFESDSLVASLILGR